jgi:hypothetical protein
MVVTSAPARLRRTISFPRKFTFSWYVPGFTSTVSPLLAEATIADWMVGNCVGTIRVAAIDEIGKEAIATTTRKGEAEGWNRMTRTSYRAPVRQASGCRT